MYTLIIVDDEYEIRQGLSNYFPWNEIGFAVKGIFENPIAAMDYVLNNRVDVVLSDIKMPKMSGLEFAKRIYESGVSTKFVFLSGYKNFDYLKEAMEYRIYHYLLKPVTSKEIQKTFGAIKAELDERNISPGNVPDNDKCPVGLTAAITTYLSDNFATTNLEDAASHFRMSPNYFSKYFKQKVKENFSDYLTNLKMGKALELMGNPEYKIYHISEMVGYTNPNNFSRAFKKEFGKSPLEYRCEGP